MMSKTVSCVAGRVTCGILMRNLWSCSYDVEDIALERELGITTLVEVDEMIWALTTYMSTGGLMPSLLGTSAALSLLLVMLMT